MKYLLSICLVFLLLVLHACNTNSEENEQNEVKQESSLKKEQDQTKTNPDTNDDNMFHTGEFEMIRGEKDIGTYETGPISLTIEAVSIQRGKIDEDFLADRLPQGEIQFVEVMMTMISEKDNILFTEDNFQLTTDSGEKFSKPYGLLSTSLNINFAYKDSETGSGDYYVTLTYILEKSKADSLEEVHLYIKSPTDQNGNSLGDDINVDIPLTITDFE